MTAPQSEELPILPPSGKTIDDLIQGFGRGGPVSVNVGHGTGVQIMRFDEVKLSNPAALPGDREWHARTGHDRWIIYFEGAKLYLRALPAKSGLPEHSTSAVSAASLSGRTDRAPIQTEGTGPVYDLPRSWWGVGVVVSVALLLSFCVIQPNLETVFLVISLLAACGIEFLHAEDRVALRTPKSWLGHCFAGLMLVAALMVVLF